MHIISNIALISINETLIVQLVSFLIFMYILNRVMIRPLRGIDEERKQHVISIRKAVEKAESDFVEITEKVRQKEVNTRREASAMQSEIAAEGARKAARHLADIRIQMNAKAAEAAGKLDKKITSARVSVQSEATSLATKMTEKILNRTLAS